MTAPAAFALGMLAGAALLIAVVVVAIYFAPVDTFDDLTGHGFDE
jgi:hypothetical protein